MKKWFKIIVKNADGAYEGTEFIKAETEQGAIAEVKDNWIDYPYTGDAEEYILEADSLSYKEQEECDHRDAVAAFVADDCTKAEAEKYIKTGSEAIKAADWEQYIKDNDLRDEDGAYITLNEIRSERDVHTVEFDGEEYILLYVL